MRPSRAASSRREHENIRRVTIFAALIARENYLVNDNAGVWDTRVDFRKLLAHESLTPNVWRGPAIDLPVRLAPGTPVIWN